MKQEHQNIIVINGQTYDARSGMIIREGGAPSSPKRMFSDISPSPKQKNTANASLLKRNEAGKLVANTTVNGAHMTPRQHPHVVAKKVHHVPQKTHTLLRNGLRRPASDITPQHAKAEAEVVTTPQMSRAERAAAVARPSTVRHFAARSRHHTPEVAATTKPVAAPEHTLSVAQMHSQHPAAKIQAAQPVATGSALKEQLIQQQLHAAPVKTEDKFRSQQHRVNSFFSKQPRLMTALAGTLGVLLLIGYVTYLNLPGISMRVAVSKAGFSATMPGYKPSGYSLKGPVNAAPGQISLNFASNTNDDKFTLVQKQSGWDSQALLDNFVAKQTDNYLTYQEKGLTIFMYDGKASWVNGGVWYNVNGSADLSSDQILKLATSM